MPDTIDWLGADGLDAKSSIRQAAAFRILNYIATLIEYLGLAIIAQALLNQFSEHKVNHFGLSVNWQTGFVCFIVGLFLSVVSSYFVTHTLTRANQQAQNHRQSLLMPYVLPASSQQDHPESAVGALMLQDQVNAIADYTTSSKSLQLATMVEMVLTFILLIVVHWPSAIILALSTCVVPMNMWVAGQVTMDGHNHYLAQLNHLSAKVLDAFKGIDALRRFEALKQEEVKLEEASNELTDTNYAILKKAFISSMIMDTVVTFSMAVMAMYIGFSLLNYLHWGPQLSLAAGLLILLMTPTYFMPFREMAAAFHHKQNAAVAAKQLAELSQTSIIQTPDLTEKLTQAPHLHGEGLEIDFGHPKISVPEFDAQPGQHVAIVGPSGSGKTTILKAIAGVLPTEGLTWNDGQIQPDIRHLAWIGAETLILNDSLRANLLIANPDATDRDLFHAIEEAQLMDWFATLDEQLDTKLGDNAIQPSAGEKKRLAIARAILRHAQLWLLDEPTSHLDQDSENQVIAALETATKGLTTVTVTHSHQVLKTADKYYAFQGHTLYEGGIADENNQA
jgi:ATP-binding cassette subfamily C protein CydD